MEATEVETPTKVKRPVFATRKSSGGSESLEVEEIAPLERAEGRWSTFGFRKSSAGSGPSEAEEVLSRGRTSSRRSTFGFRKSTLSGMDLSHLDGAAKKLTELKEEEGLSTFEVELEGLHMAELTVDDRRNMVQELKKRKSLKHVSTIASLGAGRRKARNTLLSAYWQICMSTIIVCDGFFLLRWLYAYSTSYSWHHMEDIQVAFFGNGVWQSIARGFVTLVFAIDVYLRILAGGWRSFYARNLNKLDLVVAVLGLVDFLIITVLKFSDTLYDFRVSLLVLFQIVRALRLTRQILACPCIRGFRYMVSQNRRRYIDLTEDFDLDLTYVTSRVVAMGLPTDKFIAGCCRNPLQEVARFFDTRHPYRYRVVNVCPELPYDITAFDTGSVITFDVQDHAPPTMAQFVRFINDVQPWMSSNPSNVLAVHCKAGKGRTGSMVVAWLLYTRQVGELQEALDLYTLTRTDIAATGRLQGVETPSQVRYLRQFEQLIHGQVAFVDKPLRLPDPPYYVLNSLSFRNVWAKKAPKRMCVAVHVIQADSGGSRVTFWSDDFGSDVKDLSLGCTVAGDVRVSVFDADLLDAARAKSPQGAAFKGENLQDLSAGKRFIAGKEPGCLFFFLFHTGFLDADGEFVNVIGASEAHPGVDKAWTKCGEKGKYNADGTLILRHGKNPARMGSIAQTVQIELQHGSLPHMP